MSNSSSETVQAPASTGADIQAPAKEEVKADQAVAADPAAAAEPAKTESAAGKSVEAKTTTEEPAAEKKLAPEKYDLKLPEGSILDQAEVERVATLAKEKGLTNDHAQLMLDQRNEAIASFVEAHKPQGAIWNKQIDAWETQALEDKEIGGSKEALAKTAELTHRVVEKYATPSFKQLLDSSGYGSHPEVIRFLKHIAMEMSEDQLVVPGANTGGYVRPEDLFYPNMKKE
jgi:hypothetical protein